MELRIFNSILFNELRPWQPDNLVDLNFIEKLRLVDDTDPVSSLDLFDRLNILLSHHPRLIDFSECYLRPTKEPLIPSIFLSESSSPFDAPTEFYKKLIKIECIRARNNYCAAIDDALEYVDKQYRANIAWKNIRYIIVNAHDISHHQFNYVVSGEKTPEYFHARKKIRNSCSVLSELKIQCIILFFEIQTIFKEYLTTTETPDHFFRYVLKQDAHYDPELEYSSYYYERQIDLLCKQSDTSTKPIVALHTEIKDLIIDGRNSLIKAFTALENLMFLKHGNIKKIQLSFANLANPAISAMLFDEERQIISHQINQLAYGNQRYDQIQECLESLASLPLDSQIQIPIHSLSSPRRLQSWLRNQSETYRINLSAVFSIEPDPLEDLKKRANPLPKKKVATLDENKKAAKEMLNFMSGINIRQEKIMSADNFSRMINYTFHLIETDDIPPNIKKIPQVGVSNEFIRYTYYSIHKALYGTHRIHPSWIEFLHAVFTQFSNTNPSTTRTKFSKKPPMFESDMSNMYR